MSADTSIVTGSSLLRPMFHGRFRRRYRRPVSRSFYLSSPTAQCVSTSV